MRIPRTGRDQATLDLFRGPGFCEMCGRWCRKREPHHVLSRGMGGGGTMDVRLNLVAVGSTTDWQCPCHTMIGAGKISMQAVLDIVGRREKLPPETVRERLDELRRLPKDGEKPSWLT